LKSANRSKSAFLATLTHEIRTPLNAVTSAAHLLGRTPLTEAQKEHVAILLNGSEILLSLINDVLDMSKIEAGKLEAEIGDVDLAALTEKVAALWAPKSAERGLKLAVVAEPELPRLIRTDALRLNQILFNLISNAVKFTAEGGVTLLVSRVEGGPDDGGRGATKSHDPVAHPTPEGAWLRFEVTDTGPGMSREVLGRLFKSFEQADARVALRYGGTGLGLAISSKLAGLLGGRLTVKSELGAGSTFQLDIPLVSPEVSVDRVPEVGAAPPAVSANAGLSILLAEDHPINRRLVDLILQPIGWDLTMVENGAEAVEMAIRRPFDVILLDMQMPVMSGLEAAEAIRAGAGPNATTPIAALTANAFEDQRLCWKAAGAEGFLTKPINPALLIETIAALAAARGPCPTAAAPLEGPSVPSAA
jgi:CheY-like chemotaxis protein